MSVLRSDNCIFMIIDSFSQALLPGFVRSSRVLLIDSHQVLFRESSRNSFRDSFQDSFGDISQDSFLVILWIRLDSLRILPWLYPGLRQEFLPDLL